MNNQWDLFSIYFVPHGIIQEFSTVESFTCEMEKLTLRGISYSVVVSQLMCEGVPGLECSFT